MVGGRMRRHRICCTSLLVAGLWVGHSPSVHSQDRSSAGQRENKEVVKRYVDGLWNQLRYELIDQVFVPEVVAHAPNGMEERGSQRFHQVIPAVRKAFPDLHLTIDDVLAEGDRVAVRLRITGTHEGEFAGMAPT